MTKIIIRVLFGAKGKEYGELYSKKKKRRERY